MMLMGCVAVCIDHESVELTTHSVAHHLNNQHKVAYHFFKMGTMSKVSFSSLDDSENILRNCL